MTHPETSFASLLIIGAGPAGLSAAVVAAEAGLHVTLVDENPFPGGQIWRGGQQRWKDVRAKQMWQRLQALSNVRYLPSARVLAVVRETQTIVLEKAGRILHICWEKLILCSGARELYLPFPGWTLPGVTGAGGLQALIKAGADLRGKRVVIAGTGPLLLAVADTVRQQQGKVLLIAEHRNWRELMVFTWKLLVSHKGKFLQALALMWRLKGISYFPDSNVTEAIGEQTLRKVKLRQAGKELELDCDYLACAYGLVANTELAVSLGCVVKDGFVQVDRLQQTSIPGIWAAGEATGIGGVEKALVEGRIAAYAVIGKTPDSEDLALHQNALDFAGLLRQCFSPKTTLRDLCKTETIVCRCEDIRANQLERHLDWRSAKLITRAGMGACQGRICGAACQFLYGWNAPDLRQPVFPAKAATLAELNAACHKEMEK